MKCCKRLPRKTKRNTASVDTPKWNELAFENQGSCTARTVRRRHSISYEMRHVRVSKAVGVRSEIIWRGDCMDKYEFTLESKVTIPSVKSWTYRYYFFTESRSWIVAAHWCNIFSLQWMHVLEIDFIPEIQLMFPKWNLIEQQSLQLNIYSIPNDNLQTQLEYAGMLGKLVGYIQQWILKSDLI